MNLAWRFIELRATRVLRRGVRSRVVVGMAFLELTQTFAAGFARRDMVGFSSVMRAWYPGNVPPSAAVQGGGTRAANRSKGWYIA